MTPAGRRVPTRAPARSSPGGAGVLPSFRRQAAARIPRGARLALGVSGGADSMALLYLAASSARAFSWTLGVVHVHHGLRGRPADRDEDLVRSACARLGVPCRVVRVSVPDRARATGVSLEMAARAARQEAFAREAERVGAWGVLLAHTADDQAETVILRLARGSGLSGLAAMRPVRVVRGLRIARPLLGLRHADLVAFLRAHRLAWREDASNRSSAYLRNRVRRRVLPLIERELNPSVREALARTAGLLAEDDAWLESRAEPWRKRAETRRGGLREGPLRRAPAALRRRVIQHWLRSLGATPGAREVLDIEEALLHPGASGRMDLGEGRVIERRLGVWRAAPAAEPAPGDLRLRLPGRRQDEGDGWILEAAPCRGYRRERERGVGRYPARAWIDARRAEGRLLRLRTWCAGDRMRPWGRGGSAKIQDVLTAAGVKGADRRRVRVLECGGDIVWLPGYRIALDWAVPDSSAPSWRLELRRARRL